MLLDTWTCPFREEELARAIYAAKLQVQVVICRPASRRLLGGLVDELARILAFVGFADHLVFILRELTRRVGGPPLIDQVVRFVVVQVGVGGQVGEHVLLLLQIPVVLLVLELGRSMDFRLAFRRYDRVGLLILLARRRHVVWV